MRRGHGPEFKVRWTGFGPDEDSWEPQANLADCEALDTFLGERTQQAPPAAPVPPRRSPRDNPSTAALDAQQRTDDGWDDTDGRVQMVMSALRNLQTADESLSDSDAGTVMQAIRAGIASIEQRTPKTYREAMGSSDAKQWQDARKKELDSMQRMGVWEEVPRSSVPAGKIVLPYKEVFKIKLDELGNIAEHKYRLTPRGDYMKHGRDFHEICAHGDVQD